MNGSACDNERKELTAEDFIQSKEKNLETIRNSNSITHNGSEKMVVVEWMNAALGVFEGLLESGPGTTLAGQTF